MSWATDREAQKIYEEELRKREGVPSIEAGDFVATDGNSWPGILTTLGVSAFLAFFVLFGSHIFR